MNDRVPGWVKKRPDLFIGLGIAVVYVAWLLATARSLGFSRDEGFYFSAATEYEKWFKILLDSPKRAFEQNVVDGLWHSNSEHPSLMKSLFAISHWLFHEKWQIFADSSTAWRFPGMCMMGLALFVTYRFATEAFSRRAGIVAAIALGLMPRIFYHAHLACFDIPIMAMWTSTIYVYWRAEKEKGFRWAIFAGIMYGLTLETKHNAWMMPAVFLPHALLVHGRAMSRYSTLTRRLPIPRSLVMMVLLGPIVFVGLWPWLWNDTANRIQAYAQFHLNHEYYNIEYLGRTYFGPPSPISYMPVMILATVPSATLVLFAIGAFDRLRLLLARLVSWISVSTKRKLRWPAEAPPRDRLHTDVLLFLGAAVALGPFILSKTPIFGGTKHWITAYPFLCMFAGRGFDLAWTALRALIEKRAPLEGNRLHAASAITIAITFSGALAVTVHSHPFGLSSYVPAVGGTAGGADLGLNRQFWGFTTQSLDPWLEKNAKPNESFFFMDTAWPSWQRMEEEKRLPPLRGVGSPAEADISIVHLEQHIVEVDYNIWTEYKTTTPTYVLTHDGVPIITLYRKNRATARQ